MKSMGSTESIDDLGYSQLGSIGIVSGCGHDHLRSTCLERFLQKVL